VGNYSPTVIYVKRDSLLRRGRIVVPRRAKTHQGKLCYCSKPPPFAAPAGFVNKLRARSSAPAANAAVIAAIFPYRLRAISEFYPQWRQEHAPSR
jgi:hypothetical protein